jgi:hypothetical protein
MAICGMTYISPQSKNKDTTHTNQSQKKKTKKNKLISLPKATPYSSP